MSDHRKDRITIPGVDIQATGRSWAMKRMYWGCTTFHCDRGFYGSEEAMPRDWEFCPSCGGELTEITSSIPVALDTGGSAASEIERKR